MSGFDTFADLRARVLADTGRTSFGDEWIGFVRMAETRMFRGNAGEVVRVPDMDVTETITATSGNASLPARFIEARSLVWVAGASSIEPMFGPPRDVAVRRETNAGGTIPYQYTVDGGTIKLWPAVSGNLSLSYVRAYAGLSADGDTNWLLVNHPGVYFHGILVNCYRHLRDPDRMAAVGAEYMQEAAATRASYARSKMTPTSVRRISAFAGV